MGGESSSTFQLNSEDTAFFEGNISLDNNGGFSSAYIVSQKNKSNSKVLFYEFMETESNINLG
jgi:hypothetical protein